MKIFADLQIHSRFSRATSPSITLSNLEKYARLKGINLLGTGDFTHPKWLSELKNELKEDGSGILKSKSGFKFVLQGEISNIYTQDGKVRKIHTLLLARDFDTVGQINESLLKKGFNATTAAAFLLEGLTQLRREGLAADGISNETIEKILSAEKSGKILKDDLLETARSVLQGKSLGLAVSEKADGRAGNKEIEEAVKRIVERNAALIKEKGIGAFAALMGDAMKELGGKASGKDISEALKRELQKNA